MQVLAVNLGKNKETEDAAADFCRGVRQLSPLADVLVINVSSPNTPGAPRARELARPVACHSMCFPTPQAPHTQGGVIDRDSCDLQDRRDSALNHAAHAGLRALQDRDALRDLVTRVQREMDGMRYPGPRPPLLVKIAPDLSDSDRADIAAVALDTRIDGLVIGNTTTARPGAVARHPAAAEAGGLSGQPLFEPSTALLRDMYARTAGAVPIVGCGGVASGRQAYEKLRAGASLVELYTGLVRIRCLGNGCNAQTTRLPVCSP